MAGRKAKRIDWTRLSAMIVALEQQGRWRELLAVSCATFTGCRPGDWTRFTWDIFMDPDGSVKSEVKIVENKIFHLAQARGKKKRQVPARTIVLVPRFRAILQACYEGMRRPKVLLPMFSGSRGPSGRNIGVTVDTANSWIKALAKEFDIPNMPTNYSFRKTFARQVYDNAPSERHGRFMAQKLLNHASTASTERYIGLADDEMVEAFNLLNF